MLRSLHVFENDVGERVLNVGIGFLLVAVDDNAVDTTSGDIFLEFSPRYLATCGHVVAPVYTKNYCHDDGIHPEDVELGLLAAVGRVIVAVVIAENVVLHFWLFLSLD